MNRSNSLRVLGLVMAALAGAAAWAWLLVTGCERPACRIIGVYQHRVESLPEYIDYIAGADLYRIHGAASVAFSCDALRDQVTKAIHEATIAGTGIGSPAREELERLGFLGAKREGRTLYILNNVTVGQEGLQTWARQVHDLVESDPKDRRDNWVPAVLRRLFQSVIVRAGDKQVEIPLRREHICP